MRLLHTVTQPVSLLAKMVPIYVGNRYLRGKLHVWYTKNKEAHGDAALQVELRCDTRQVGNFCHSQLLAAQTAQAVHQHKLDNRQNLLGIS